MKQTILLTLFLPLLAIGQKGIKFEHGLSWKQIQEKAVAENKYVFVDAWTTWCGPCIYMDKNIFPQESVGDFFNKNFINVKMQLDTTAKDTEETKARYQDGHDLMTTYTIRAFPTYLFFNPAGQLVHRSLGASPEAEKFIAKAQDALNPETQYYTQLSVYNAGYSEPVFLKKMAFAAREAYDEPNIEKFSSEYLATQKEMFTKDNINFLGEFTTRSSDVGFNVIKNNPAKYDAVKGKGAAHKLIVDIILREDIYPKIYSREKTIPDWEALTTNMVKKYPKYSNEIILNSKVNYYKNIKDWPKFQTAVMEYVKKYSDGISVGELNDLAWTVFENCKDAKCLQEALQWSKRSFADNNNPMFIDTYANLLYKLGKKDEAMRWQEKAIALVNTDEKLDYQETLEKMKNGEKTWKN